MSALETLLHRLEAVKPRARGSWIARCPAHEDRSPSLSIREAQDGVVLLKCFAGCSVDDIVQAVGLVLSDLFPPRTEGIEAGQKARHKPPVPWRDCLRALRHHLTVVAIASNDIAAGRVLAESDLKAMSTAAEFVRAVLADVEFAQHA